ncbi:MAG TPA: YlxR family protein [Propionibacteriaceae bacterium]|nr:YlxR family protein [Propionibacteriaceae bacterium]
MTDPVRTCVGCRRAVPASDLVRYVDSPEGPVPDPGHRLPGRGAWLHDDPACRAAAERRNALARSLRRRR